MCFIKTAVLTFLHSDAGQEKQFHHQHSAFYLFLGLGVTFTDTSSKQKVFRLNVKSVLRGDA